MVKRAAGLGPFGVKADEFPDVSVAVALMSGARKGAVAVKV